ncbi:nucleoredoxin-like protein 2 isoform X2 [Gopherus evgoodei]|uniref:nucleoredoxin-like protein 2 isoform X2 n=1 Tax=Gopherus evgoodei TaxID=1825980 RepID=UPI0011CF32D3|nr:nucleoredoxin-like protein 2 isoform X2 [Gopherus evgoodei]
MVDVFSGRPLLTRDGRAVDPEEVLQNKIVGLYFSAGWCSPCRDFTPVLCDFYSELLEGARPPAPFEVVFISSDRSPEEMAEYMHDMHGDWLALPFHDPYKQSRVPYQIQPRLHAIPWSLVTGFAVRCSSESPLWSPAGRVRSRSCQLPILQ